MKRTLTFGALTAIIIGVLVAYQVSFKDHDDTADIEAAHKLNCEEVGQEFLDDETAATAKYVDQILEINGPILAIERTDQQITSMKISMDELYVVNATLQNPFEGELEENSEIVVKGVCSGFLGDAESMLPGGVVELKRGSIIK